MSSNSVARTIDNKLAESSSLSNPRKKNLGRRLTLFRSRLVGLDLFSYVEELSLDVGHSSKKLYYDAEYQEGGVENHQE